MWSRSEWRRFRYGSAFAWGVRLGPLHRADATPASIHKWSSPIDIQILVRNWWEDPEELLPSRKRRIQHEFAEHFAYAPSSRRNRWLLSRLLKTKHNRLVILCWFSWFSKFARIKAGGIQLLRITRKNYLLTEYVRDIISTESKENTSGSLMNIFDVYLLSKTFWSMFKLSDFRNSTSWSVLGVQLWNSVKK